MKKLIAFASALILTSGFLAARDITVDYTAGSGMSSKSPVPAADGLVRKATVRKTLAKGLEERLSVGDTVTFKLFPDTTKKVIVTERMESPLSGNVFIGRIDENEEMKSVVLLETADGIFVEILDPSVSRVYKAIPSETTVDLYEYDPSAGERTDLPGLVPVKKPAAKSPDDGSAKASDPASTHVDILIVYDQGAKTWAGSNGGGITNFAEILVQKMNTSIANTELNQNFHFRLVGVTTIDDTVTNLEEALSRVVDGLPPWSSIPDLRTEVGADIVCTLIDTGSAYGYVGLGYSLEELPVSAFAENAYNACSIRSVNQAHTMTHEVGHNMGAGHGNMQASAPGPQLFSYSSGYYFTAGGDMYHTIMAYNSDGYTTNRYKECPYFSSPEYTYEGSATGTSVSNNNSLTISKTYGGVINFRPQKIAMSYDVFFSPESGAVFSNSVAVTLTAGKAGPEIYYTLDGSTPTTSSTLYSDPIILSSKTTIKAIAVTDGTSGPVFTATYFLNDLGDALDAPQLQWTYDGDMPWYLQTTNTHDGIDAAISGKPVQTSWNTTRLTTSVIGPKTMSFWYKADGFSTTISVLIDNGAVASLQNTTEWSLYEVQIPSGTHTVVLSYRQYVHSLDHPLGTMAIDQVKFDALSEKPVFSPQTTAIESTATKFQGSLEVSCSVPAGGTVYYTTDGTTPTIENTCYDGPFTITKSTIVKAICVQPGKDQSTVVSAFYLERHPVMPGEWTTDSDGAVAAARTNGNLIVALLTGPSTLGADYCELFKPIAESTEFLQWAAMNRVYLITTDSSRYPDTAAAKKYFDDQYDKVVSGSAPVYSPSIVVSDGTNNVLGADLVRDGQSINTVTYNNTAGSLIAGLASYLGVAVPSAPVAAPDYALFQSFPVTITLTNTNGIGDIYYTLDGSIPKKEDGIKYTGPFTLQSATVVKASVWTTVSGPILCRSYKTFDNVFGSTGITWTTGGTVPWVEFTGMSGTMRNGSSRTAYSSWLQASVTGNGKLIFSCTVGSYSSLNKLTVTKNGSQLFSFKFGDDGSIPVKIVTFTNDIVSTEASVFKWTYEVGSIMNDLSDSGAWLYDLQWIPGSLETTNDVPVPYSWIDMYYPGENTTAEEYNNTGDSDSDGDGFKAWEEYLAGTVPTNGADFLQCTISVSGGSPKIEWNRTNTTLSGVSYSVEGKASIGDASWSSTNSAHRFFRVKVSKD